MASDKLYYDYINELSSDEIYEGLLAHGLFAEKYPPIFTSEHFFEYYKSSEKSNLPKGYADYIRYETIKNTNVPRPLGIPNPIAYGNLCKFISNNWKRIQAHFNDLTKNQEYKISRVHIRKLNDSKAVFSMNYKNWKIDGSPEDDLLIGAKYAVKSDISNCFSSIYTHAIPWAIVGRDAAKKDKNCKRWYNKLDYYIRSLKCGETHGLLIGPHASNLLSEIILVKIDKELYDDGWRFIRNIDDYTCYVRTYEEGKIFITQLSEKLGEYNFYVNSNKTKICELPTTNSGKWVPKLKNFIAFNSIDTMGYKDVQAYLDLAIEMMRNENDNTAVLNYAIKVISNKKLYENAKIYYIKTISHLVILYPYLVPLLEKHVFDPFKIETSHIYKLSNILYKEGIAVNNYEEVCYAIYFAMKYNFSIDGIDFETAKSSGSCLFMLLCYLYYKRNKNEIAVKKCKEYAKELEAKNMDLYWLFIYEVLSQNELSKYWKDMKDKKVTFLSELNN